MNILYIVSGLGTGGGIEKFCKNILDGIHLDQYQIDFLVTSDVVKAEEKEYIDKGCQVYHISDAGGVRNRVKNKKAFFKNLKKSYDIVHIHTVLTSAYYFAKLVKKYTSAKVIMHSHTASNYEGQKLKNDICRFFINHYSDYKVACSKIAGEFLFGNNHCKDLKIIYNMVDVEKFKFQLNARESIRKEWQIDRDTFLFLNVGRLTLAKNHDFLLESFHLAQQQNPNMKLMICGGGEEQAHIEAKVKELGLVDKVIMTGNRSDVSAILAAADCFLLPSRYEGLPTVLIEAQASALPIIYSQTVTSEVILKEDNISCLPITNPTLWCEEMLKYCHLSVEREKVDITHLVNIFGLDSVIHEIEVFYDLIVGDRR